MVLKYYNRFKTWFSTLNISLNLKAEKSLVPIAK